MNISVGRDQMILSQLIVETIQEFSKEELLW